MLPAVERKAGHYLYLPIAILLVMMVFTQSRGPIIALALAFCCTLHLRVFTRRNLAIVATLAVVLGLVFFLTPVGDLLLARFEEMGTQSGLRFSIWRHTLAEIADHPGWAGVRLWTRIH